MKVPKRFDYINSDWLIFGEGPANRSERQLKATLFVADLSNTNRKLRQEIEQR